MDCGRRTTLTGFARSKLNIKPLAKRMNKLRIQDIAVSPDDAAPELSDRHAEQIAEVAERIIQARNADKPVILTYGAHLIKNGLGPVVIRLMENGWITHVATNGAGSIHDWEFAYLGESSEDVRENIAHGEFGIWDETGRYINLAVLAGVVDDLGYGWSVGKMISEESFDIWSKSDIDDEIEECLEKQCNSDYLAALADMRYMVSTCQLPVGITDVAHPYKAYSVQRAAYEQQIPFTVHPGIGYDIIYTHPFNCGGAIGRGAVRDFLAYADSISRLSGGVHLAVGSAIMAPMIFEKSMSMANNIAIQRTGSPITDHFMAVVDIQDGGDWDWSQGEPPMDHPAYYLRFCKSFHRMGGTLDYICLDNRDFLLGLHKQLMERYTNRL
jgi:hypothetical protein